MIGALADRRWVFVDVVTTGSSPARSRITEVGVADELAAAASLVMGQAGGSAQPRGR